MLSGIGDAAHLGEVAARAQSDAKFLDTLSAAVTELRAEELDFRPNVDLGVMIEVAAAVPMVRLWSRQAAFFSLSACWLRRPRKRRIGAKNCPGLRIKR